MLKKSFFFLLFLFCTSCSAFCASCFDIRRIFDTYKEECVFANHHQKWEEKNCKFRIVQVDKEAKFYPLEEEK